MSPTIQVEKGLVSALEVGGKSLLLFGAFCYGIGFLVVNLHAARYGYYRLGLFERQYPLAGLWALAPIGFFLILLSLQNIYKGFRIPQRPLWRRYGTIGLSIAVYLFAFHFTRVTIEGYLGLKLSLTWGLLIMYGGFIWLMATGDYRVAVERARSARFAPGTPSSGGGLEERAGHLWSGAKVVGAASILLYIGLFTYGPFREIPPYLGGGGSNPVQIVTTVDKAALLRAAGVPIDSTGLSQPLWLVLSSDQDLVLLPPDTSRVIIANRQLVEAVLVRGTFPRPPVSTKR